MRINVGQLRSVVRNVLVENRVQDTKRLFPDVDEEKFKKIVDGQPQGSNNTYLRWSVQSVLDGGDVKAVVDAVNQFHSMKNVLHQKDINKYYGLDDLLDALLMAKRNTEKKPSGETVYDDGQFVAVRLHSQEAACKYGSGTRWCISSKYDDGSYFSDYERKNKKIYVVINRAAEDRSPLSKIAIIFDKDLEIVEIRNSKNEELSSIDDSVENADDLPKFRAAFQAIKSDVKKNPNVKLLDVVTKLLEKFVNEENVSDEEFDKLLSSHEALSDTNKKMLMQALSDPDLLGSDAKVMSTLKHFGGVVKFNARLRDSINLAVSDQLVSKAARSLNSSIILKPIHEGMFDLIDILNFSDARYDVLASAIKRAMNLPGTLGTAVNNSIEKNESLRNKLKQI